MSGRDGKTTRRIIDFRVMLILFHFLQIKMKRLLGAELPTLAESGTASV
jgi:hypothetical protein